MKTKPILDLATEIVIQTWGNIDENDEEQIKSIIQLFSLTKEEVIDGAKFAKELKQKYGR